MEALNTNLAMTQVKNENIALTFNKERARLFNFIRKRVSFNEEAEDILQDVFYQFVEGYQSIESLEKSSSWLFTVARNKITDYFRKKKPQTFSESKVSTGGDEESFLSLEEIIPDLSALPDQELFSSLISETLEDALEDLPEEQREVFVMHEFENKSFQEIADIKNEKVNTLISRKRYAILYLRERLRELYNELI